jgi:Zn-dependent M28 family amino/carboxypeptidase
MRRIVVAAAAVLAVASVTPAAAGARGHGRQGGDAAKRLAKAVSVRGMMEHESALQGFADATNGTRAAGTPGYDLSVDYVVDRLRRAGYNAQRVPFEFPHFQESAPSQLARVGPTAKTYGNGTDFVTAEFSAGTNGPIDKQVVPTNDIVDPPSAQPSSTSGCEAADFPPATAGNIALVQRGTCPFADKIANAKAAGAVAVILFNEGQAGRTQATPFAATAYDTMPVLSASYGTGKELYDAAKAGPTTVGLQIDATTTKTTQDNVIADTRGGDPNQTIVVGSHLDSVPAGPGINDNGSGSAQDLEIAESIAKLHLKPKRRIRFAFWGAEEEGLLGSTAYVNSLPATARKQILLNLNFDMVASPNFVRFVYDGDNSDSAPPAGGTPAGSDAIEKSFLAYFSSVGLATAPTAFDGRSDYGPFIAAGIPAGGLDAGAEGVKSAEEARVFGGTAGQPYDSCYHQACDTIKNLNRTSFRQLSDAAATVLWKYAGSTDPLVKDKRRPVKPKVLAPTRSSVLAR